MEPFLQLIFTLIVLGIVVLVWIPILKKIGNSRDEFFKDLAQKYNLQFAKLEMPHRFTHKQVVSQREISGTVNGKKVLIQDIFIPRFLFFKRGSRRKIDASSISTYGSMTIDSHYTRFLVDGVETIYPPSWESVARKYVVKQTLQSIAGNVQGSTA